MYLNTEKLPLGFEIPDYRPSLLFKNHHVATMYPYGFRSLTQPIYQRQRWVTEDNDFIDLDFIHKKSETIAVLMHGLEGSARSQYILGLIASLQNMRLDICAVNHRSCSGEPNNTLGFYHSGFTKDLAMIVDKLSDQYSSIHLIGYSLGGNMILKYLGSHDVPSQVKSGLAYSVPCDLSSSAVRLNHWSNRPYAIQFLQTLKKKIKSKAQRYPELLGATDYQKITTLYEYDNKVTAPLHGFTDAEDYYEKSSSKPYLTHIKTPTLLVNALDDSFLAPPCHPKELAIGHPYFHFYHTTYGGHVGFGGIHSKKYWSDGVAQRWLDYNE